MQLQVVGHWAPYPKNGEACSGYVIKQDETTCLLDCGHGVMSFLGRYTDAYKLNLVIISHFHPDHYVDLHALRHLIRAGLADGRIKGPIDLYIPDEPRDQWEYWQAVPEFHVYAIRPQKRLAYPGLIIDFYSASHPLMTYAVRFTAGQSTLFYTADSSSGDELWKQARGVDILLGEASLLAADGQLANQLGHMTTVDLARGAIQSRPGVLVATHLWPGFDAAVVSGEIHSLYWGETQLAYPGLSIDV